MNPGAGRARGLWFRAPYDVGIDAVDVPAPTDGEVLVRTLFSGISAGTEMLAYRGELDSDVVADEAIGALGGTFDYPFQYGYSSVGVVEATRSAIGEGALVFAFQPHQTCFVAGADDVVVLRDVDARTATLFPYLETALQITLDAEARLGELVVVVGLGVVGLLTAVMLQRTGAAVLAAEPHPWRRDAAALLGISAVDTEDLHAVTSGLAPDGVSLVIEASGSTDALPATLPLLAHEGTALVASWYGTKPVLLPLGANFHRRRLTIRSTQVSTIPARLSDRWSVHRRRATVAGLLAELDLGPVVTHTFPFDRAHRAYDAIDRGEEGLIHAALGYDVAGV